MSENGHIPHRNIQGGPEKVSLIILVITLSTASQFS